MEVFKVAATKWDPRKILSIKGRAERQGSVFQPKDGLRDSSKIFLFTVRGTQKRGQEVTAYLDKGTEKSWLNISLMHTMM